MRILKAGAVFFSVFLLVLAFQESSFCDTAPIKYIITIESVQLKKDSGEWITVIEPDHQVDLANQDPTVSFFNNGRRVPPGNYENFRIIFNGKDNAGRVQIFSGEDFSKTLKVQVRSFVSASFELNLAGSLRDSNVKNATVVVDNQTLEISGQSLRMVFE